MIPLYQNRLTPDEFEACVKQGVMLAAMSNNGMDKEAEGVLDTIGSLGDTSTRLLLTLSVVTGVPVGIMMHVVGKKISQKRAQDKQMLDEAGYYSNAAKGIESEMARQGIKAGEAGSFITNGLKDDARSPIPKSGVESMKSAPEVPPTADYLKKVVSANIPNPSENTPGVPSNLKVSHVLRMLKMSQESEIETGDEDNDTPIQEAPGTVEQGPMFGEPSGLLAAVGQQPKDPQQQQAIPQGPTPNNEVVNKSNITAPGLMMSGNQRSQMS